VYLRVHTGIFLRKIENSYLSGLLQQIGTLIAKWNSRTRRVDKGKSGQAQKTAVSGGFGGGILSQILQAGVGSFGGTERRL
jgi:hypothetical protein